MFLTHPGIASWCHFHSQITKKTTLESTLQLGGPNYEKVIKMIPKLVPRATGVVKGQSSKQIRKLSKHGSQNGVLFKTFVG